MIVHNFTQICKSNPWAINVLTCHIDYSIIPTIRGGYSGKSIDKAYLDNHEQSVHQHKLPLNRASMAAKGLVEGLQNF